MPRTTSAADRARRLIALLGRLTNGARLSIEELSAELATSPRELAADLESLSMCGVAPYDPSVLVPIIVEDGIVEVYGDLPAVRGSVRLSSGEAAALAAALQAAGFDPEDSLASRLLDASASDFDASELAHVVRTAVGSHDRDVYETLAAAARDHQVVELEYAPGGAESPECRLVEPAALFAERGAWYISAWCRRAAAWRTFRVDRVRLARTTGSTFEPRPDAPDTKTAFDPSGLPSARLRFSAGEEFTEREWPGASVVERSADGSVLVEVPYAGSAWIARRVVARLGRVVAIEPAEVRDAVRELAAQLRASLG